MDTILFIICAIFAVASALNLVLQKHPISSALSLIGVMGSLAVLYLLLGAEFIAMAQMIVYGGAVMVLFVFVIMLLNAGSEKSSAKSWFAQIAGVPLLSALVALLAFLIRAVLPNCRTPPPTRAVEFGSWVGGTAQAIGMMLFTKYLLPFEVVSILILIAILGAVVLARKEID
jgi:NADH-quinone oxidoreductase subunit J